jgi:hypothetical protein
VYPLRPYRALNRGGGKSQYTLNGSCSFSYFRKSLRTVERGLAGLYKNALLKFDGIALLGNLELGISAGS